MSAPLDDGRYGSGSDPGYGGAAGRERGPPGGRGGSGGQRDGDWVCPNTSCGNLNFARRVECNKCGSAKPAGVGGNSGYGGAGNRGNRSTGYGAQSGNSAYSRGGSDASQGAPARYSAGGYAGQSGGDGNGAGSNYGGSYPTGSVNQAGIAYGSQEGAAAGVYSGQRYGDSRASRGGSGGVDSREPERGSGYSDTRLDYGRDDTTKPVSQYGGSEAAKVKQCDGNCADSCDNSRIYISGLPLDVTIDELRELFGGIGQVARIKQKRGYKDQWPWNIKIYTDDGGKNKGDAVLSYEDPFAAHSAGGFFNDFSMRGHTIKVTMAEKSAPRPSGGYGQGSGGDRGGGYGGHNSNGPDRRFGGGYRSRPY